ncbi:YicC/YloC family endoribonuclease [Vagococcus silagei]|uniref:YicC family protein n=1 Tax=Vagococcus silagei TaxID=2508885 RepID=A0A4S3B2L0_9ENTE|nr:YicC/YloC family endoribonuclease [Vagococcus silagei]THB61042.1 YicC family protein [Vagococcus silagei]
MKSMTGYGKAVANHHQYDIAVEMKSVNHRFLDIALRMPRELNSLELALKKQIKEVLVRGRVDCFVTINKEEADSQVLKINWSLLDQLVEQLTEAEKTRYKGQAFSAKKILNSAILQDTLFEIVEDEIAVDELAEDLKVTFQEALLALDASRLAEGESVQNVLTNYINEAIVHLKAIEADQKETEQEFQTKLFEKVTQVLGDSVHEERIFTEIALLLEKGDISEETDRLGIHFEKGLELVQSTEPIGKNMDFLIQEMNREVNTIGSKTSLISIKEHVLALKSIIEKMREQIQNIE